MLYFLVFYFGFCMGCSLIYDLDYNNNLDYSFRFNKIPLHVILIRLLSSPVLIPIIFISETIDYVNSKYI